MTVFERRALLKLHGLTHARIAREIGRSASTIGIIVNCYPKKKSRAIQEHIARCTATPYEALWGVDAPARASRRMRKNIRNTLNLPRLTEGVNVKTHHAD